MIFLGADHRGFELKETLKKRLESERIEVSDLGDSELNSQDDYVDYAKKVATSVADHPGSFGVLLCGSGAGVDMVANKIDGVRSALVQDEIRAKQAREHEDANVVSLPADILDEEIAFKIVKIFIETPFSNEDRHVRRIEKMQEVEEAN